MPLRQAAGRRERGAEPMNAISPDAITPDRIRHLSRLLADVVRARGYRRAFRDAREGERGLVRVVLPDWRSEDIAPDIRLPYQALAPILDGIVERAERAALDAGIVLPPEQGSHQRRVARDVMTACPPHAGREGGLGE
jgi:hypothetical protein